MSIQNARSNELQCRFRGIEESKAFQKGWLELESSKVNFFFGELRKEEIVFVVSEGLINKSRDTGIDIVKVEGESLVIIISKGDGIATNNVEVCLNLHDLEMSKIIINC